ncbi:MAG: hypothetical protein RL308_353 [Bacteroidota bacterium]|jgi:hypothetical protein
MCLKGLIFDSRKPLLYKIRSGFRVKQTLVERCFYLLKVALLDRKEIIKDILSIYNSMKEVNENSRK